MGWKLQNASPPAVFIRSGPNFMINTAVIVEYKVGEIFGDLAKNTNFVAL